MMAKLPTFSEPGLSPLRQGVLVGSTRDSKLRPRPEYSGGCWRTQRSYLDEEDRGGWQGVYSGLEARRSIR